MLGLRQWKILLHRNFYARTNRSACNIRKNSYRVRVKMNEHSNPIEFLIDFAWANGADRFVVNNAKDQLKKLQEDSSDSNRWLSCEKELTQL